MAVWPNEVFDSGRVILVTGTEDVYYAIGVLAESLLLKHKSLDQELASVIMHFERIVENGNVYFVHPEEIVRYRYKNVHN